MRPTYARLAAYVAANYQEPLSLARIAKAVGLYPVYAARVFRRIAGTTLLGILARHRVAHAQQLLATRDTKIADIALGSGFGSLPRFYAVFQKMTRQTPRAYRRKARKS